MVDSSATVVHSKIQYSELEVSSTIELKTECSMARPVTKIGNQASECGYCDVEKGIIEK